MTNVYVASPLVRDPGALAEIVQDAAGGRPALVVIDQLEELVTLASANERERFAGLLSGRVPVLATLRGEFLDRSLREADLDGLIDRTVLLGPLDRGRIAEVIAAPARRAAIEFAPGLVERMADDTRGGDALPLLAYTLQQLYAGGAAEDRVVTHAEYDALGGVAGALVRRADAVAVQLGSAPIVATLLELTTLDAEGAPARRAVPIARPSREQRTVADAFVQARLLILDGALVQVAHEALLRVWPPLRDAIDASRQRLRARADLSHSARDWEESGRDVGYLLRGTRLLAIEEAVGEPPAGVEHDYLAASLELEAQQRKSLARRRQRTVLALGLVAGVLAVATLVSLRLADRARDAQADAESQAKVALARQLMAQAELTATEDRSRSLRLALAAQALEGGVESHGALFSAVTRRPWLLHRYAGAGSDVRALVADARADRLVSIESDGRLVRRRLSDGQASTLAITSAVTAAISPDGRRAALSNTASRVELWDLGSGRRLDTAGGEGSFFNTLQLTRDARILSGQVETAGTLMWAVGRTRLHSLAMAPSLRRQLRVAKAMPSPDGELIAVSDDRGLRVVERRSGRLRRSLPGVPSMLLRGYTPDGRTLWGSTLVTQRSSQSARLVHVDLRTGNYGAVDVPLTVRAQIAFSSDSRVAAVTLITGRALILDAHTGATLAADPNGGHTRAVAFDRHARVMYTGDFGGDVTAWGYTGLPPIASGRRVRSPDVAFSLDGRVAAGVIGRELSVWPVTGTQPPRLLGQTAGGEEPLAFDARARRMLVRNNDRARVIDIGGATPVSHRVHANATAISPDGTTVAITSGNETIELQDIATRARRVVLHITDASIGDVRFSRDGRTLTALVDDRLVRIDRGRDRRVPLARKLTGGVLDAYGERAAVTDASDNMWLLDLRGAKVTRRLVAKRTTPYSLSPGGRWLATLNGPGDALSLWDTSHSSSFATMPVKAGHPIFGPSWRAQFVPGRETLALVRDGTLEQWDFSLHSLKAQACTLTGGAPARERWHDLVGTDRFYTRICP